jgi:hypothetical protein
MQKLCRELHTGRQGGPTKWQFSRNLGNANLPLVKEIVKKSSRIQHLVLHEENQRHWANCECNFPIYTGPISACQQNCKINRDIIISIRHFSQAIPSYWPVPPPARGTRLRVQLDWERVIAP